uniref:Protein S-acyltransferase n=1 Tax=Haemonchus placei TaxID=6290 RepID=A0A0N4X4R0_HAEPC
LRNHANSNHGHHCDCDSCSSRYLALLVHFLLDCDYDHEVEVLEACYEGDLVFLEKSKKPTFNGVLRFVSWTTSLCIFLVVGVFQLLKAGGVFEIIQFYGNRKRGFRKTNTFHGFANGLRFYFFLSLSLWLSYSNKTTAVWR